MSIRPPAAVPLPPEAFDRQVAAIGLYLPAAERAEMRDAVARLAGLVALLRRDDRPPEAEGLAGWTPPTPPRPPAGR